MYLLIIDIFICIYIYRERERERDRQTDRQTDRKRESIQQEINFFSKSFRQRLSQLHIYIKILLQLSNLQIVFFFTNFNFSLLQEWEYQYKKN